MIMKLKMFTIGKIFGKICGVKHEEKGDDSIFSRGGSEPSPVPLLIANPDPK